MVQGIENLVPQHEGRAASKDVAADQQDLSPRRRAAAAALCESPVGAL